MTWLELTLTINLSTHLSIHLTDSFPSKNDILLKNVLLNYILLIHISMKSFLKQK